MVEDYTERNLIVMAGRVLLSRFLTGEEQTASGLKIAFGTNGQEADIGDTEITNPFFKDVSFSYPEPATVKCGFELLASEANGLLIHEFGLYTGSGILFARRVRQNPISKEGDISIEGNWTIQF